MTRRIVLATRNAGKIAELRRILADADADVELVGTEAFADLPDVAETGTTSPTTALAGKTPPETTGATSSISIRPGTGATPFHNPHR